MATESSDNTRPPTQLVKSQPHDETVDNMGSRCLAEMRKRIREATDELVRDMGLKIVDAPPPRLRGDAAPGILWGYSLPIERLEMVLADLQNDVVDGALSAQKAVDRAHQSMLEAIEELRYGSHVRRRYFGTPTPLPPAAELGRMCAIVERLAKELTALADACGVGYSRGATIRVRLHSEE